MPDVGLDFEDLTRVRGGVLTKSSSYVACDSNEILVSGQRQNMYLEALSNLCYRRNRDSIDEV
jgi:hypothetical protein